MDDIFDFACALVRVHSAEITGDPKFLEAKVEQTPCRVSADLRIKQHQEDQYIAPDFNPWEDDHVGAVVPAELRKPAQALLLALEQIETTERSFGVDRSKAYDALIEPLKEFRAGCIDIWKSL